jgi:crossover junction endodeoxyribonuclease RuvC
MATFTRADRTLRRVAVVRILGIDPGTMVVGYGCLEIAAAATAAGGGPAPLAMRASNVVRAGAGGGQAARLLTAGVLRLGGRDAAIGVRLHALAVGFRALVRDLQPTEVAIEEAFHGKSVQAALRIGEARGVVLAEATALGLGVHQFAPARVKRCVTGNGAADKTAVAAMVRQFVRPAPGAAIGALPLDATDAVAVAWTRLEERRSPILAIET